MRRFDADVRVAKEGGGEPVRGTSLTNVVALGARFGDTLVVGASGPQASEVIAALQALADEGFGDGVAAQPPPVRPVPPVSSSTSGFVGAPSGVGHRHRHRTDGVGAPAAPASGLGTGVSPAPALPGRVGGTGTGWGATWRPGVGGPRVRAGTPPARLSAPPPERPAGDPAEERRRLIEGIDAARTAIEQDRETVAARAGKSEAAIFDAHLALLEDEALLEPAQQAIDAGSTAERAWH